MVSGVIAIHERDPVDALVKAIEEYALKGGLRPWQIVDLFKWLSQAHWDAYARIAQVPTPTAEIIGDVKEAYKRHVGYFGSG